jgi:hypothetical protein
MVNAALTARQNLPPQAIDTPAIAKAAFPRSRKV